MIINPFDIQKWGHFWRVPTRRCSVNMRWLWCVHGVSARVTFGRN